MVAAHQLVVSLAAIAIEVLISLCHPLSFPMFLIPFSFFFKSSTIGEKIAKAVFESWHFSSGRLQLL